MLPFFRTSWRTRAGLIYVLLSAGYVFLQAIRGWRGITLGHYRANIAASRILLSGSHDIYNLQAQQDAANAYFHTQLSSLETFVHPPQTAWVLIPLAKLDPRLGYAIFLTVILACILTAGWVMYRYLLPASMDQTTRLVVAGTCLFSSVLGYSLWWGEWDSFMLLPAVAGVALVSRGRGYGAGLMLSLLLVKPNLMWLLPVLLIAGRQWRVLAGFTTGAAVWLLSTPLIMGFDHTLDWVNASAGVWYAVLASVSVPGAVSFVFSSTSVTFWCTVSLGVLVILASWFYRNFLRGKGELVICLGIAATLVATPYVFEYGLSLLAVPLCLWARTQPRAALSVAVGLSLMHLATSAGLDWHWEVIAPVITLVGLALTAPNVEADRPVLALAP